MMACIITSNYWLMLLPPIPWSTMSCILMPPICYIPYFVQIVIGQQYAFHCHKIDSRDKNNGQGRTRERALYARVWNIAIFRWSAQMRVLTQRISHQHIFMVYFARARTSCYAWRRRAICAYPIATRLRTELKQNKEQNRTYNYWYKVLALK